VILFSGHLKYSSCKLFDFDHFESTKYTTYANDIEQKNNIVYENISTGPDKENKR